ncbi:uncharacterized protein [Neodiprion pinetum]|uniref:uncharacterized protein n=1 Tax=Neodiprion pinetum TaxID=441929 RepID=UPI001EE127F3|nr:uncharacterized protein LOC124214332 [Neodiprion pinetum]
MDHLLAEWGLEHIVSLLKDEDNDKLSWLKTYIEPWGHVVEYWDRTYHIRRRNLIKDNTSVADYIKTYRCLRQELGAELIHRDFEKLYPGKSDSLLNRWDAIRTRLSELLQGPRKPKGLDNELLVNKLKTLSPENQDALILYLLPTLVKATQIKYQPVTKKRKIADSESSCNSVGKGRNKKPSTLESQEAFVLHVYNAASVEPAIANKKAQLLQQGLTAQPHIVLVGPLDNIQASYVVVDDVRYTTTSPLRALDLTFKTFYATDCQYPIHAFHIWLFIQKVAYDITNTGDKFGTNINTLIGEVLSYNQAL